MSAPFCLQLEADVDSYFVIIKWKWKKKSLYISNVKNSEKEKQASEI